MHTLSEPLFIRDPLQKTCELPPFVLGESSEQRLRMFARNSAYCFERRAPLFCDMQSVTAAIVGILTPFDKSSCFHIIDQGNQPAWNHSEGGGERLLRDCGRRAENPQNAGMWRSELQARESPGKLRSGMSAHLG